MGDEMKKGKMNLLLTLGLGIGVGLGLLTASLEAKESKLLRSFNFSKTERIPKSLIQLKEILLDYENFCMRGCKYTISHLKTLKVLEEIQGEGEKTFTLWDEVEGLGGIATYHSVKLTETADGQHLETISTIPSAEVRTELRQKYGLAHKTPFSSMEVTWEINQMNDAQGGSEVTYFISAASSDARLNMFHKKVIAGMAETTKQMFKHLRD